MWKLAVDTAWQRSLDKGGSLTKEAVSPELLSRVIGNAQKNVDPLRMARMVDKLKAQKAVAAVAPESALKGARYMKLDAAHNAATARYGQEATRAYGPVKSIEYAPGVAAPPRAPAVPSVQTPARGKPALPSQPPASAPHVSAGSSRGTSAPTSGDLPVPGRGAPVNVTGPTVPASSAVPAKPAPGAQAATAAPGRQAVAPTPPGPVDRTSRNAAAPPAPAPRVSNRLSTGEFEAAMGNMERAGVKAPNPAAQLTPESLSVGGAPAAPARATPAAPGKPAAPLFPAKSQDPFMAPPAAPGAAPAPSILPAPAWGPTSRPAALGTAAPSTPLPAVAKNPPPGYAGHVPEPAPQAPGIVDQVKARLGFAPASPAPVRGRFGRSTPKPVAAPAAAPVPEVAPEAGGNGWGQLAAAFGLGGGAGAGAAGLMGGAAPAAASGIHPGLLLGGGALLGGGGLLAANQLMQPGQPQGYAA